MKTLGRWLLIAALVGVILVFGGQYLGEYRFRSQYNSGIELINTDKYPAAEKTFTELLAKYPQGPRRELIHAELLKCYHVFAVDPDKPIAQRAAYARKVKELAPGELTEEENQLLDGKE